MTGRTQSLAGMARLTLINKVPLESQLPFAHLALKCAFAHPQIAFLVWLAWISLPYSSPLPIHESSVPLPRGGGDAPMDKRVFLSRGWGPGGYEVPSPQGLGNSQDMMRLARLLRKEGTPLRRPSLVSLIAATPSKFGQVSFKWKLEGKNKNRVGCIFNQPFTLV